jgi:L-rhamnose mutarotase
VIHEESRLHNEEGARSSGSLGLLDYDSSALLPSSPIVKKWWKHMADIMETNPDNSPVQVELKEMFHMD